MASETRRRRSSQAERDTVDKILQRFPETYAGEAGVKVRDAPQPLFQLAVFALLASARIRADVASKATRALWDAGWTSPQKMVDATWEQRTKVLNRSGYARYDESTSRMLADSSHLILDRWDGDLRNLREEAERDRDAERRLLQELKGIGPAGAGIFAREVQSVWPEQHPSVDDRAVDAARRLGLGDTPDVVAQLVTAADLPHLVDALVRIDLTNAYADIA
jgi:endonuclease III